MALIALSDDELNSIFSRLCNPLRPCDAMNFGSANHGLWVLTKALRDELKEWHASVAALGCKVCPTAPITCWWRRMLREATEAMWVNAGLSATDLTTLATLGSVLPALGELRLIENLPTGTSGPDGVQLLAVGLGAGALPALTLLQLDNMYVGNAGASALGAALSGGALPRLERLLLDTNGIGDAGLVALAPALRGRPALQQLLFVHNPLGQPCLRCRRPRLRRRSGLLLRRHRPRFLRPLLLRRRRPLLGIRHPRRRRRLRSRRRRLQPPSLLRERRLPFGERDTGGLRLGPCRCECRLICS